MVEIQYAPSADTLIPWSECHSIERWHYDRMFAELRRGRTLGDWLFIVTESVAGVPRVGARVVVILKSDEQSRPPMYADTVQAIFRNYHRAESHSGMRSVFPLPLPSLIPNPPPLRPTPTRRIDIAFMGHAGDRRRGFVENLVALQATRRDLRIEFIPTGAFRGGLSPAEYSRTLADSRIALCPRGGSVETFRFTEALQHGCVVIAEKQPPHPFYLPEEYHVVADWSMLGPLVQHLLPIDAESRLASDAAHQAYRYWERALSPEAVAQYVLETLKGF